ncbi:glucan endo-1,3-beta-D-glucosidase-like [Miscanthus floridulus]|uniref:glucan endo-1,3-beta-D-glucosidase-like n=1 Tax=Miscanthus floridulus TaxID=154761 RepID=UPI00345A244D
MRGGDRPSASLLLFSLGLVLLYFTSGSTVGLVEGQKTWCIAKPSASNEILAQNLDYACSQVSCAVIQKGGPCYYPDSLVSRAAVAMNLYYAYSGRHPWNCYFNNSALVVQSDPTYGSCTYY